MAICCYCKFKPPKEDENPYGITITGQSRYGKKRTMSVPIENLSTNRENMGGVTGNNNNHYGNALPGDGLIGGTRVGTTQFSHVNTESHHALNEYTPASGDQSHNDPIYPTGAIIRNKQYRSGSNATTGSATSDEDVLKGAYGGHITAGGDDPFPRDKLRTINDGDGLMPHNMYNPNQNIITPIDMVCNHFFF